MTDKGPFKSNMIQFQGRLWLGSVPLGIPYEGRFPTGVDNLVLRALLLTHLKHLEMADLPILTGDVIKNLSCLTIEMNLSEAQLYFWCISNKYDLTKDPLDGNIML